MTLADRLTQVRESVAEAARLASRDPEEISVIPVTKFHSADLVRELYALGVREFAENRHQEAKAKAEELSSFSDIRWNFVGQLQRKKARQVREYARVIQSIDRIDLVDALANGERDTECFIQINLSDDPARGGCNPLELEALTQALVAAPQLSLQGVMGVAPLGEEPAAAFERLAGYSERVRTIDAGARFISAGMSGDFVEAINHGATHLRIGTAITGNRVIER